MTRASLSTHDAASLRKGTQAYQEHAAENGYTAAQDGGGAEFGNFRSVTPGGHKLDTVSARPFHPALHASLTEASRL